MEWAKSLFGRRVKVKVKGEEIDERVLGKDFDI